MSKIRVAINGFGRIGRNAFKAGFGRRGIDFAAINDLTDPKILAHLLKYDSVFRAWNHKVGADAKHLIVDGKKIPVTAEREPLKLPWKKYKVDVVIESTGRFTELQSARQHLAAGAKRVVISAPAKEVPTYLMGVNHTACPRSAPVINNASCTTNSVAPIMAIMQETLGVRKAMMTTVHSVTAEQNLVDGPPPGGKVGDLMVNIVPTSTGAARAATEAVPKLKGLFDGIAIRVPTLDVSLSDFTMLMARKTSVEEINSIFKKAAAAPRWKGVLGITDEPLVSADFIGSAYSAVVDLSMTRVVDGDLAKILAWYDNEWGYSVHLIELAAHVGQFVK